jgi:hypothetical protein
MEQSSIVSGRLKELLELDGSPVAVAFFLIYHRDSESGRVGEQYASWYKEPGAVVPFIVQQTGLSVEARFTLVWLSQPGVT